MFEHFLKYQNGDVPEYPSYRQALHEIVVDNKKSTHWIWYVIPYDKPSRQHDDLFVIKDKEVPLYLQNTQLRNNYIEILDAIFNVLRKTHIDEYNHIMSDIDLKKVYESAILFKKNAVPNRDEDVIDVCDKIITVLTDFIVKANQNNNQQKRLHLQLLKHF